MNVEILQEEINHIKTRLAILENRLKEIQHYCDHHYYKRNHFYEVCAKCNKINVLYY
ncbi:serine protease [Cytobacillus horneckiae]|uniref:Serine protease n=1 Tax=Cytobacillus horneckiae TaxID=549687 RepID=A0A2N0ZMS2_9BACI|nr:serine protease [Cytobacillus horneckiae]MEC1159070.1 serine protease [Cytobacillus horneckiae]MED2938762.1 serine protease [Cytobacillus horneckiae]PKG30819.1 serine protease [Cytobacillus horneckiae]